MLRHLVDMEAKAWVPFERTRELARERFDIGVPKAGVEDKRLHVESKSKGAMNVRFDVVVESIPLIRCGEINETHARRRTERGRIEAGIGKAECAARRDPRPEPQVGGTEPGGRSGRTLTEVQCADFRALVRGGGVIGPTEEPRLPVPAVAARIGREASGAGAGDELRAVLAIVRQATK